MFAPSWSPPPVMPSNRAPSQTMHPPPSWSLPGTPSRPVDALQHSGQINSNLSPWAPTGQTTTFAPGTPMDNLPRFDTWDQTVRDQPFKPPSSSYASIGGFYLRTTLILNAPEMVVFDLSSPKFGPMQYHPNESGPPTLEFLPVEELWYAAIQPPTTALDICCGPDFKWCIEFRLVDTHRLVGRVPPPITVGDVLVRIYQFMSQPMEEADWTDMEDDQAQQVRQAYETRCNVLGGARRQEEREKGPKKIDYFGGKVWFGGLDRLNPQEPGDIKTLKLTMWSGDRRFSF